MFFKTKRYLLFFFSVIIILFSQFALASDLYWLCGPDEDGCPEDGYEFCVCIPHNDTHANQPYCLDFDELGCAPLSEKPDCNSHFVFQDQTSCLATIFHSIPDNPCTLTTKSFCTEHHTAFCEESGNPRTCKYSPANYNK